jgi:hypothetical protein
MTATTIGTYTNGVVWGWHLLLLLLWGRGNGWGIWERWALGRRCGRTSLSVDYITYSFNRLHELQEVESRVVEGAYTTEQ